MRPKSYSCKQKKVNYPVNYTELKLENDDWKLFGIKRFGVRGKKIKWNKTGSLV